MKIVAYCALRYGQEYLGSAIRSVIDHVSEFHVLYAVRPSHGTPSHLPCPDNEHVLHDIAWQAAGTKLKWHRGNWSQEYEQRNSIFDYAPDADVIIVLDADEVWTDKALNLVQSNLNYQGAYIAIPMIHQWRSFHKAITNDSAAPARILFPKSLDRNQHMIVGLDTPLIHFGYAQRKEVVFYKAEIHGHKSQWRRDCNWYEDKFLANAQTDVHPTGHQWMTVSDVNPDAYMPEYMKSHPYYHLKLIE